MHWHNVEHRHSGINYVSPEQRHGSEDVTTLAARDQLYQQAREQNPARWSVHTRNWKPIGAFTLNPVRDSVIQAHATKIPIQQKAARFTRQLS